MGLAPIFCFRGLYVRYFGLRLNVEGWSWIPGLFRSGLDDFDVRNPELTELVTPAIADLGLECLGVEYSPSSGTALVRIYIDHTERLVTVDDCEIVSRQVSALFDVNDPIAGRYTLEVSSPGLDRPLYTPQHFARFIGEQAKLELNLPLHGRRRFQGPIRAVEGDTIVLEQDGEPVHIAQGNIHRAKLVPDFAEPVKPGKKPKPGKKAAENAGPEKDKNVKKSKK
jgi:ribosome maturation factor RimP